MKEIDSHIVFSNVLALSVNAKWHWPPFELFVLVISLLTLMTITFTHTH